MTGKIDIPKWFNRETPPPNGLQGKAKLVAASAEEVIVEADIWRDGEPLRRGVLIQRTPGGGWSVLGEDLENPSTSRLKKQVLEERRKRGNQRKSTIGW